MPVMSTSSVSPAFIHSGGNPASLIAQAPIAFLPGDEYLATIGGQREKVVREPVAPRDLEGHETHLPRPARRLERLLLTPHLQDVDGPRAQLDAATHGDRVDDPAVDEVLLANLHRGQNAGHGAGGQHHLGQRPLGEPVLRGPLDRCGDALERTARSSTRWTGSTRARRSRISPKGCR